LSDASQVLIKVISNGFFCRNHIVIRIKLTYR